LVGSLLYATQTRPDIQFSVNLIAQFGGNPGIPHLEAAKRILRYLKGTQELSLVLGRQGRGAVDIVGWTDSDWAGDVDSRHSVGGFVFDVTGGCVSWSLKKQVSVCHKSPTRTKDSTVGGMGRTRAILRRTRRRVLKIEKGDKIR